jgi:hypothetical protein
MQFYMLSYAWNISPSRPRKVISVGFASGWTRSLKL